MNDRTQNTQKHTKTHTFEGGGGGGWGVQKSLSRKLPEKVLKHPFFLALAKWLIKAILKNLIIYHPKGDHYYVPYNSDIVVS